MFSLNEPLMNINQLVLLRTQLFYDLENIYMNNILFVSLEMINN